MPDELNAALAAKIQEKIAAGEWYVVSLGTMRCFGRDVSVRVRRQCGASQEAILAVIEKAK